VWIARIRVGIVTGSPVSAANLLGISVGDLITVIERTYYNTDGRPVETADITVADVRWEIAYEIGIEPSRG
jgi:GntR family transcriptional regulator